MKRFRSGMQDSFCSSSIVSLVRPPTDVLLPELPPDSTILCDGPASPCKGIEFGSCTLLLALLSDFASDSNTIGNGAVCVCPYPRSGFTSPWISGASSSGLQVISGRFSRTAVSSRGGLLGTERAVGVQLGTFVALPSRLTSSAWIDGVWTVSAWTATATGGVGWETGVRDAIGCVSVEMGRVRLCRVRRMWYFLHSQKSPGRSHSAGLSVVPSIVTTRHRIVLRSSSNSSPSSYTTRNVYHARFMRFARMPRKQVSISGHQMSTTVPVPGNAPSWKDIPYQ